MRSTKWFARLSLIAGTVLVLAACSPAVSTPSSDASQSRSSAPKRITLAVQENVSLLWGSGADVVGELYLAGLVALDPDHLPRAQLAEAVPTLENGLWRVLDDGRMEMTWKLRPDVRWHDGVPLTAEDVVFSALTPTEFPELQLRSSSIYRSIDSIRALDDRTIVAIWKTPHARADWLFSHQLALPFARHIVESGYRDNKEGFTNLRYWSTEMVGSGPFTVKEFVPKSHLLLSAFDQYVFGRPKIDEIEIRFIDDANTLMANLLAGSVDLTLGSGLSVSRAKQIEEHWREGTLIYGPPASSRAAYPQFIDPDPSIQANLQFRRALAHAIDRQELIDSFQAGLGAPAHMLIADKGPDYEAISPSVQRFDFDARRSAQLIEQLGYTRGADNVLRDAANVELSLPLWAAPDASELALAVSEYWRRIGIVPQPHIVPPDADRSVMPSRPAIQMAALQTTLDTRFHSSDAPLPANGFRGSNRARYMNPELDALLDGYFTEIRPPEQRRTLGDVVKHIAENVVVIHIFYDIVPQLMNRRVTNVTPRSTLSQAWNSHQWDVLAP
jgi:peptide/nickel transport system substrate-binding protein